MESPARLHILLAHQSPQALILRRGPSKQVAIIGWDRAKDHFTVGQWLKGRIYPDRSDISPDGRHWIYFAMNSKGQTWTAVAKTPYLKALDFYPKGDAWGGGGLFTSNRSYWLDDREPTEHQNSRCTSGLSLSPHWSRNPDGEETYPNLYFLRLAREGWTQINPTYPYQANQTIRFSKRINAHWQLVKRYHASQPPVGKGFGFESHMLIHNKSGEEISLPDAQWADVDGNRFLWAEHGRIMSGYVSKDGLQNQTVLLDANPLRFTELVAPY